MKIGTKLMLFIFILNIVSGMVFELQLPGTTYANPLYQTADVSDYETRFNATGLIDRWTATPFSGIPVVGDIFSGLSLAWNGLRFLVTGFPDLLEQLTGSIVTGAGRTAFLVIVNVLRALFSIITFIWVVQFITGRQME